MKNKKIALENTETFSSKDYPADSSPSRKDFVPYTKTKIPSFSYQSKTVSDIQKTEPQQSPFFPWELNFIVDDLADAYVSMESVVSKLSKCSKECVVMEKEQLQKIFDLYKFSKKIGNAIKKLGLRVEGISQIKNKAPSYTRGNI